MVVCTGATLVFEVVVEEQEVEEGVRDELFPLREARVRIGLAVVASQVRPAWAHPGGLFEYGINDCGVIELFALQDTSRRLVRYLSLLMYNNIQLLIANNCFNML